MPTLNELVDEVKANLQGYALRQDRITYVANPAGLTTTSTSFSDVSGLSVTITPTSSTSKIFIILTLGSVGNTVNTVKFNILRNSTNIAQPASGGNSSTINHFPGATVSATGDCASFLDSPATTSAITYKIQWAVDGSTGYLNRHTGNTDYNSVSTITAMEIAA